MRKYNVMGNEIPEQNYIFYKYDITLINNEHFYIYTLMNQISVIDCLTENKHITICNDFGFEITIFRKHIVKITEVK